jgi:aspartate racemase
MFAHETVTSLTHELPGVTVSSVAFNSETTKFDLTLHTFDTSQGLNATLEYNTDLFDAATIKRMLGHFETLLQSIATNPGQRIFNLPMLTEAERHQLLVEWNDTKKSYSKDKCIHELFEAEVERSRDAPAVIFGDQELTYRELNSRANRIAHYLRKLGVGPEVLVGVCAKRSLDMVIGLLGILKAGGAYVPLDPAYPKERLAFVLQDAQVSVLLTEQQLLDALPTASGERRVCLDTDRRQFSEQIDANPEHTTTSKNLAYVIYTSGSTGKPKGVAIEHFSVTTFLFWAHSVFTREDLTGVLASTSICFDLSVFELFAPLTCGGKVILAENALALPGLPVSSEVALVNTVPSAIAELVRMNGIPSSVRIINLAGEPLSTTLVQQIYQTSSVKCVYDLYGPSEDTTYSTCALRTPKGPKTIGRPISNTQVYILDGHMNPVPMGIPGRLYIGGDGLARGYFNRPDLTAEKFIPDPFSGRPGARLYNTGDLARYMPDGNIEFLGRIDNQVKLRGFRIELGEIEAVLCQHPAIQEAVASVRENTSGMRSLVAYVTPKNQEPIPPAELGRYLGSKLPAYMVPSAFVMLEALPLTPNGKVDRQALPAPDQRASLAETAVAPRTPTEKIITRIWANLFKGYRVGIHDNFFELGGDSLLAVRLLIEVNKEFDKKLPLAAVFQAPTIEQLAKLVAYGSTLPTWSSLYAIQPHGSKPPFFWIHGEASDAFLPRYLEGDQPLYGVRHQSEDGKTALYTTLPDIAEHYLSEMRAVQPHGPYFLGGYCFGGVVAFEMAHQLKRSDEDVRLLVMLDPDNPIMSHSRTHTAQNTSAFSSSGTSLIDTIFRHTTKLYSHKPKEKARYILERAAGKIRASAMRITANKTLKRAAYRTYLALGYAIPPSFRSRYILDIYDEAMGNYVPEIYPGRLTVFRAAYSCDPIVWESLAGEGLELHEISGDHTEILKEPHVQQWAEILSTILARAQIASETQERSL